MTRLRSIISPAQLEKMKQLALSAPEGAFAEVGVFNGGSAEVLYEVAMLQGRELYLFDTFNGTPFFSEALDAHKVGDEFAAPYAPEHIKAQLPLAKLHIGVYPYTHPSSLKDLAFVHCDCDQYLSYRAVIDHMWPIVVEGGFLLFDDYPYLAGARQAVEETFTKETLKRCGQRYYAVKTHE